LILHSRIVPDQNLVGARLSIRQERVASHAAYPATCPWFWKHTGHIAGYIEIHGADVLCQFQQETSHREEFDLSLEELIVGSDGMKVLRPEA
jgi:hypothetical protein